MAEEPSQDQIREAAEEAIRVYLSRLGPELSTGRYVLMVEAIGESGRRGVWMSTHEDQTAWDTLGLLQYGIQIEQAAQMGGDE